jgi:hypothetical protein
LRAAARREARCAALSPRTEDQQDMPKALTISGMVIAVLLLIMFGMDLAVAFPFDKASKWMDVAFLICAVLLGYMSWSTYREQV